MSTARFKLWLGRFLLMISPLFCYLIFEWITGNLFLIRGTLILWNLLFYYSFYFLFLTLTNNMRWTFPVLNLIFLFLAIAEYYVVHFRARPIMLWDLVAWRTATTVAGSYSYAIGRRLAVGIVLMSCFSILTWRFAVVMSNGRMRFCRLAAAGCFAVGWFSCFFSVVVPAQSIDVSMWNPLDTYETRGFMLCTMRMVGYVRVDKPPEYQQDLVSRQYAGLKGTEPETGIRPANIICIMNESWSDLSLIHPIRTDRETHAYYHSMDENCIKGEVFVPVFGAGTSNTEYEFLTGNSMAFAPTGSVPFQIYMKNHTPSVVESVKEQGYHTIAMHPYIKDNWNRIEAYNSLGFDEYLAIEDFEDAGQIRGYISDRSCYEKIIQITQERQDGQPLFFFLVTMQNHGGYEQDYENTLHLAEHEDYPLTEQFLSLMRETDLALEYLIEHYKQSDEPTVIAMFGDHQPGIEEEFYEELYGSPLSELSPASYLRRYETPFFVWTNYENNLEEQTRFSVVYLYNQVLKAANLPLNGYESFLEELMARVPVIHFVGYFDQENTWQSWTSWRTKESYEWLHQFELYQYYRMFGKKWAKP